MAVPERSEWRRVRTAILILVAVVAIGWAGYLILGASPLDALYQTATTITTVGFREVIPFGTAEKLFTIAFVIGGTATTLYTFGTVLEALIEGRMKDLYGRRRMERTIGNLSGHIVICGWGRVGKTLATMVTESGQRVVVVDRDESRLADCKHLSVAGDATDDETLERAGVRDAKALVCALDTDECNLFVTLSARSVSPSLFIVARARIEANEPKLLKAGADRVVNPQAIGGERMAAFVLQPNVAEFLDVVMHDRGLEFRLEEVVIPKVGGLADQTIGSLDLARRTGALVLALRRAEGEFVTNPGSATVLRAGDILIVIGTLVQLGELKDVVGS